MPTVRAVPSAAVVEGIYSSSRLVRLGRVRVEEQDVVPRVRVLRRLLHARRERAAAVERGEAHSLVQPRVFLPQIRELRREAARVDVLRLRGRRRDAVHAQLVLVRDVLHLDDALADVHGGEVLEAMPQRSVSRVQRPRIALSFRELRLELLRVPSVVRDLLGRRLVQVDRERLRGFVEVARA
eukprot:30944-Pelagococcus_subviridis.AAC.7